MLLRSLLAYAAASLVHHAHNAEYLSDYPNMPAWLSAGTVYAAWLAATGIGVAGYLLLRRGHRWIGTGLLAAYACYGLDALVHYAVAPIAAHTMAMHVTILLEAATAAALLGILIIGAPKKNVVCP